MKDKDRAELSSHSLKEAYFVQSFPNIFNLIVNGIVWMQN